MGIFSDAATEQVDLEDIRFDDDGEVAITSTESSMSGSEKAQSVAQTQLLAQIAVGLQRQNELLDRQNSILNQLEEQQ
jgi:hypothetical protein